MAKGSPCPTNPEWEDALLNAARFPAPLRHGHGRAIAGQHVGLARPPRRRRTGAAFSRAREAGGALFPERRALAVDTFDYKPELEKYAGKGCPWRYLRTERKTGAAFPSPFKFKQYGESGIHVSEIFEKTAAHIDDIAVIRSLKAKVPNHEPSLMLMNSGDAVMSRPSLGSWVNYGLGTENQNLPGFVVMCPGGYPIKEAENWRAGFLPGTFQGTFIDSQHTAIDKLIENIRNARTRPAPNSASNSTCSMR
jgi:hypothetical protein